MLGSWVLLIVVVSLLAYVAVELLVDDNPSKRF